ncbi:hypothetical protein ACFOWM_00070 [Ferruginibacter yonginensis]|uniref:Uncharacterized protein n=1 Tax=Ferruginibacter yonginensis TaxID=1310416 RepID=A0ABV8QM02_9BACT
MKNRRTTILAVLLLLAVLNFSRLANNDSIRPIQFLSIFVIGALSALLLNEFFVLFKAKRS